jgi:nucleoside phosphorylase
LSTKPLPILIVSALPEEMTVLRRKFRRDDRLVLAVTGSGPKRAERRLTDLLDRTSYAGVIGIGVAGSLAPDLRVGDLVVAREVRDGIHRIQDPEAAWAVAAEAAGAFPCTCVSVATVVSSASGKAVLARDVAGRPATVDCESATWGRIAASRGLPFAILRVISDAFEETLPACLSESQRADGSIDRLRIVLGALGDPVQIPRIVGLARRVRRASSKLAFGVNALMNAPATERPEPRTREVV